MAKRPAHVPPEDIRGEQPGIAATNFADGELTHSVGLDRSRSAMNSVEQNRAAPRHIFISYARADGHWAARLDGYLQAHRFTTWRDTRDLDPYSDFTGALEQAIRAAVHVVVCLTPDVQRSDSFVRREIAFALAEDQNRRKANGQDGLPVTPVLFPGGELPILISTLDIIRCSGEEGQSATFEAIVARIRAAPGSVVHPNYRDSALLTRYLHELHDRTSITLQRHVQALLELSATDTPAAIAPLALNLVLSPVLDPGTDSTDASGFSKQKSFSTLTDGFRHHGGRVVLLGDPGAGKTTALLAMARDAAVKRLHDPREPVPILLSLHDWRPARNETLKQWIQNQVRQADVDANRILFLLDGLDEIPPAVDPTDGDPRSTFIRQFEHELGTQEVIVTTRIKDTPTSVQSSPP